MSNIENNYICIQGWMVSELKLKGNELLVYAIIYGFSQAENQEYTGSLQYLATWTNSTKQGIINNLKSLIDKGLIVKNEKVINGVKFCQYHTTKFNGVLNKVEWGIKQSLMGGIKQSLINNINIDNINNNINNKKENFKIPTIEEIKLYCEERKNNIDAEYFYDFYESKGWLVGKTKMKDWKAAVRTWERNTTNKVEEKPRGEIYAKL